MGGMTGTDDRSFPQPREGITGTLRDQDDLLSLDGKALPRRMMHAALAKCLHRATLVGNPAPVVAAMYERITHPEPGDLVVETSRLGSGHLEVEAFGILVAHRREWWETDEEWAAQVKQERADHESFLAGPYAQPGDADEPWAPSERLTDDAWYVQYGPQPADVCRWVNCEFIVIPTDPRFGAAPVGTSDGSRATYTRDDLLGALADSGFALKAP
jgi:hypothetical protein